MRLFSKATGKATDVDVNQLYKILFSSLSFDTPVSDVTSQVSAVNKGYLYNHIVYSIVKRIVTAMAGVPWTTYRVVDTGNAKRAKQAFEVKDYQAAM